jgi:cytochrome c oxidase subunit 2
MKTTMIVAKNGIVKTIVLAAACGLALASLAPRGSIVHAQEAASSAVAPQVIEISAKKYEFSPSQITLKKGDPVILRVISTDRIHGFMSRALKVDTDIFPGKSTDIAVTPAIAGTFMVIRDHYCGTGHGNMKMKVTVVQ